MCRRRVVPDDTRAGEAAAVFGDRVQRSRTAFRLASDGDQKRHLRASPLAKLDLTPIQQARVNAALADGTDPLRWLSPRQRMQASR
jgi:hypothetical protein